MAVHRAALVNAGGSACALPAFPSLGTGAAGAQRRHFTCGLLVASVNDGDRKTHPYLEPGAGSVTFKSGYVS